MSALAVTADSKLSEADFNEISALVRKACGINLTDDKRELVNSRLQKRLRVLRLGSFREYLGLLRSQEGADEFAEMISALTTNVTSFYRESHHFDHFVKNCLPAMKQRAMSGERIRIWSAGCSNGSEPFTVAGMISEQAPDLLNRDFRILATDIDKGSLQTARDAVYGDDFLRKLPDQYAKNWFTKTNGGYQVKDSLRKLVTFRPLNLMEQWPLKQKYDAIFCRNVMIYFAASDQERLLQRFAEHAKPEGFLYIGHSERITGNAAALWNLVGMTTYQRT